MKLHERIALALLAGLLLSALVAWGINIGKDRQLVIQKAPERKCTKWEEANLKICEGN